MNKRASKISEKGKSKKIVIDARMLPYTGIGRYTENIIRNLPNTNHFHQIIIVPENTSEESFPYNANRTFIKNNVQRYTLGEHVFALSTLSLQRASLFHSMNYIMPPKTPCPSIVTIYDLIRLKIPYTFYTNMEFISIFGISRFVQMSFIALTLGIKNPKLLQSLKDFKSPRYDSWISNNNNDESKKFKLHHLYQLALTLAVAKNSKRIITISEHSKKDIVEVCNVPESKIEVVYPGVSSTFKPEVNKNKILVIKKKYSLPNQFALYVGLWRPHKNVHGLIEAFHRLLQRSYCPSNFSLVLVGPNDNFERHVHCLIRRLDLKNHVITTGFIPEDDLRIIYSLAKFLVIPSFYEGFGLPVLEAMACGTPVIASSAASLPEVVGDAGILVNPYHIDSITDAMGMLLRNDNLRFELSIAGMKRGRFFTWPEAASKTSNIYNDILQ